MGASGLGSNISNFKHCYSPVQNRRGVIPMLSKVNATTIIGLPSSSVGAYLCIFPAVVLKLFWVVVVVFADRFERLTRQSWTVFPENETWTKYFADDFKVFTDPPHLFSWIPASEVFPIPHLFQVLPLFLPLKHPVGRGKKELIFANTSSALGMLCHFSLKVAPNGMYGDPHLLSEKWTYREGKSLVQGGTARKWWKWF